MKKYIYISLISLGFLGLSACSNEDEPTLGTENEVSKEPHTCDLIMNVDRGLYDDEDTRSAAAWANGDVIYLVFDGKGNTYGEAIYSNNKWQLTYYGQLSSSGVKNCQAVYVENAASSIGSVLNLNQNSSIYEDTNATYSFDGSALTVDATLSPKTGRIRFQGAANTDFHYYGIAVYTSFNTSNGQFTLSKGMYNASVEGSYTPYIYGEFIDDNTPRVSIIYPDAAFTKQFGIDVYQAGQSGYVTLPQTGSSSGWRNHAIINVNGVDLTMIPVEYSEGNFMLAETELTEAQYHAVTGEGSVSQLPMTSSSYGWVSSFITEITQLTSLNFRKPYLSEWQYAFKGGNKSKGYTYSGSDDIYEVAWFSGNSDREAHPVKQLKANELGFYDMSGNASEDVISSFTYSYYGGYYMSSANQCLVNSDYGSSSFASVRLALPME